MRTDIDLSWTPERTILYNGSTYAVKEELQDAIAADYLTSVGDVVYITLWSGDDATDVIEMILES